ncbi:TPA: phage late control D family protein [Yersinia enterocolitica]|uniref:phage late control D family protein n=1 Tax=Yersinia enterocolitica TaxID=630 RepID=UPI0005E95908|nr:phage late control D family protein [Yersinia enterocolitica]EKN5093763.1 phage late control D family protein [Yersinia enterocolitica]ELI7920550.1 phage late control D family protein [Yersinia enterocolitica]ELI8325067.1 phage late control D family protein [Yersinia enterocolitica]CQH34467.1 gene D protein [Yersinia enterocolitica]CQH87371.1 gene D protein [Yersinia enterocolitica]
MMAGLPLSAEADLAPDFMLTINQKDITQNIRDRLLSLSLTDNRGFEADQLDIELDDADGQLTMPVRGAVLSVFLGWKGASLMGKGDFIVDEVEHHGAPDTLTIRARSADFRGSLNARREVSYHATTLGNVVAQVAERNNLQAMLAEGLADITIPHIDQTQETDAKFITRLASLNGAVAAVKAGRLLFIKPGSAVTASGKPIPQMTITRQDGDQHSFSIADRGAYTGVSASWLHTKDPKPAKPKKVKLQRKPQFKHLRALQHPKIKAPQKSQSVEERRGDYLAGSGDNVFAITTVYATQKAAMRAAQAKWEKLQRGVAEFSITLAMGRADLFPETPIMVSGFKSVIDQQKWIISKVMHHLNNSGYTTQLVLEVLLSDVTYHVTA